MWYDWAIPVLAIIVALLWIRVDFMERDIERLTEMLRKRGIQ